jgi:glucokinase
MTQREPPPILVLDVGGTKLAAGVMLGDDCIHARQETGTPARAGAEAILKQLIELAAEVAARFRHHYPNHARPAAVGLASAGYIDHDTGSVLFATDNLPGWTGQPLGERLAKALALPAFVANDAACFALAEATLGAGRAYRHVLVVAVGTGVGGGVVIGGELYSGWQGRAGAIGHLCVEPANGRPCTCGLAGCLESYSATRIMVAESGFPSIQALAARYRAGDEIQAVDEAARWLGVGLASLVHVLGPEVVVIGGSVALLGERYLSIVRDSFALHSMPLHRMTPILAAQCEADIGLLGAGILARRGLARVENKQLMSGCYEEADKRPQ